MLPLIPCDDAEKLDEKDEDIVQNCSDNGSDQDSKSASTLKEAPLLASEPGVRHLERVNRAPKRYDPILGESDVQVCHNIVSKVQEKKSCLEYDDMFVAHVIPSDEKTAMCSTL